MAAPTKGGIAARSLQDVLGGAFLILIAAFALYLVRDLPAAGRVGFAAGTAPRLFAWGLMALGAYIAVVGYLTEGAGVARSLFGALAGAIAFALVMLAVDFACDALARATGIRLIDRLSLFIGCLTGLALLAWLNGFPAEDRHGLNGPLAILGSVVLFAVMVRDFGLAVTGVPMVMLASLAARDFRPIESIIFGVTITTFCAILFPTVLGQPIPLWPQF